MPHAGAAVMKDVCGMHEYANVMDISRNSHHIICFDERITVDDKIRVLPFPSEKALQAAICSKSAHHSQIF